MPWLVTHLPNFTPRVICADCVEGREKGEDENQPI